MKYSLSIANNHAHFADFLSSFWGLYKALLPRRIFPPHSLLTTPTLSQTHWDYQQICYIAFFLINVYNSWTASTKDSWKSEYFFHTVHEYWLIETFIRKCGVFFFFFHTEIPHICSGGKTKVFSSSCPTLSFQLVTKWRSEKIFCEISQSSSGLLISIPVQWFLEFLPKVF